MINIRTVAIATHVPKKWDEKRKTEKSSQIKVLNAFQAIGMTARTAY